MPPIPHGYVPRKPELATDPNLIDIVRQSIRELGVVGEHTNVLLIWLTFISRLSDDPGHLMVCGPSGTGKSTLVAKVSLLLPAEAKVEAMTSTPSSWFNEPDPYFCQHKVVISGERKHAVDDNAKDDGAMLRQMLSEKKITRRVSTPGDMAGTWISKTQTVYGPISYVETTTSKNVFHEDKNRMLQIHTDSSDEQKGRVVTAIGDKYSQSVRKVNLDKVLKKHHDFQNYLQQAPKKTVIVPYHKGITAHMDLSIDAVARMTQLVFSLIESIAVTHQAMRRGNREEVVATVDDYRLARDLLVGPFRVLRGEETDDAPNVLWKELHGEEFTSADVKKVLQTSYRTVAGRAIDTLTSRSLVVLVSKGSGNRGATYRFVRKPPLPTNDILPTVEQVLCVTKG